MSLLLISEVKLEIQEEGTIIRHQAACFAVLLHIFCIYFAKKPELDAQFAQVDCGLQSDSEWAFGTSDQTWRTDLDGGGAFEKPQYFLSDQPGSKSLEEFPQYFSAGSSRW